jgi:hypothetical protein
LDQPHTPEEIDRPPEELKPTIEENEAPGHDLELPYRPTVPGDQLLAACRRRVARRYAGASRLVHERDDLPPGGELSERRREQALAQAEYELLFGVAEAAEHLRRIRLSQQPAHDPIREESHEERDAAADCQRALEQLRLFEAYRGQSCSQPRRAEIERRARELLKRVLTEEQWDEYRTAGFVTVDTARFRYRIYPIGALMLDLRTGVQVAHTCLQFCSADPPAEDRMLAEYLLIRNDEERYLRTSNVFWASRRSRESP